MKSKQLIVFTAFSVFSLLGYASVGGLLSQSTPLQSYESAKSAISKPTPSATASGKDQMGKVESIMANAKKEASSDQLAKKAVPKDSEKITTRSKATYLKTTPAKQSTQPESVKLVGASKVSSGAINELESQMSQLNQAALLYQQDTDQKIENLTSQNEALKSKMTKLTEALLMINQQLGQIVPAPASQVNSTSQDIHQKTQSDSMGFFQTLHLPSAAKYFAFALLIILVVLTALVLLRRKTQKAAVSNAHDDTEDEYDFMGSREAIPAKLDLARAYLDMDDTVAAHKVLKEVLREGDGDQQKTASDLLKKINDKT